MAPVKLLKEEEEELLMEGHRLIHAIIFKRVVYHRSTRAIIKRDRAESV